MRTVEEHASDDSRILSHESERVTYPVKSTSHRPAGIHQPTDTYQSVAQRIAPAEYPDALQAVMESVPASIYIVNRESKVVRFNSLFKQEMTRVLGIEITEGYDFNNLQGVGNAERWRTMFERAFAGLPVAERWEAIVPGHSNVLDIACHPIYKSSEVTEVAVYIKNLTDEVRLTNDYQDSMERSKLALESTYSLAFDWDIPAAKINATNLEGITGYSSGEVTLTVEWWMQLVIESDRDRLDAILQDALSQSDTLNVDYRILDRENRVKDLHTRAAIYRDFDGSPLRMVGTTQDITSRKNLERELIEARNAAEEMNRLKTSFLANMSHEIRTPLTAIIGYADILSNELNGSTFGDHSEVICRSGKRLLETINSLIDLAKIESNMLELVPEELNINFKIACIVEELLPLAYQRSLKLSFDCTREQFICFTDRKSLISILYNLIGNALKFTNTGGVTVSLRNSSLKEKKAVAIHVSDTGIGIRDMQKIFMPFVQESHGFDRSHEGNGLGLSITRKLVEALEGTIEVTSEEGKGSTFIVTLPVKEVRYS